MFFIAARQGNASRSVRICGLDVTETCLNVPKNFCCPIDLGEVLFYSYCRNLEKNLGEHYSKIKWEALRELKPIGYGWEERLFKKESG